MKQLSYKVEVIVNGRSPKEEVPDFQDLINNKTRKIGKPIQVFYFSLITSNYYFSISIFRYMIFCKDLFSIYLAFSKRGWLFIEQ